MRESNGRVKGRAFARLACLFVCALAGAGANAEQPAPRVVCRATLAEARRAGLAAQLRAITGWAGLHFDGEGFLRFGSEAPSGGSQSARELLAAAPGGGNLTLIEE